MATKKVISKKSGMKHLKERRKYLTKFNRKNAVSVSKSVEASNADFYRINDPVNARAYNICLNQSRGNVVNGYTRREGDWHHHHVFRYLFNNIRSAYDIQNALEEVYRSSTRAFRFSVYFHSIWEERVETDYGDSDNPVVRYHYFSSVNSHNRNPYLMVSPGHTDPEERMYFIRNRSQLNHYKDQLNDERIQNFMNRNNTRVRAIGIYKVEFKVVRRNVPLGSKTILPSFLINCKNIKSLKDVDDGDCFWACMALANGCRRDRWKAKAKELKSVWERYTTSNRNYSGMTIEDIIEYEKNVNAEFAINIIKIENIEDNKYTYTDFYVSDYNDDAARKKIYLNIYFNHLSFITAFEEKVNKYSCEKCGHSFKDTWHLIRHSNSCDEKKPVRYANPEDSVYRKDENLIYKLCRHYGRQVFAANGGKKYCHDMHENSELLTKRIEKMYKYDFQITYDTEEMFAVDETEKLMAKKTEQLTERHTCSIEDCQNLAIKILWSQMNHMNHSSSLVMNESSDCIYVCADHQTVEGFEEHETFYVAEHIPSSVAMASNIPGFEKWYSFSVNPVTLVSDMFVYIDTACEKAGELMLKKMKPLIEVLEYYKDKINLEKVKDYCTSVPIIGFNNAKYDNNVLTKYGFIPEILKRCQDGETPFVIKCGSQYKTIKTRKFVFLDAMLYVAPGNPLSKYISTYLGSDAPNKFHFPYEKYTSNEFLLTPIKDYTVDYFYSSLKCDNTLDCDSSLKKDWNKEKDEEAKAKHYEALKKECTDLGLWNKEVDEKNILNLPKDIRIIIQFLRFKSVCEKENIKTGRQLLQYYNEQDVEPFLRAVLKQKETFYNFHIDIFKDAVAISGIAQKILSQFMWKPINKFIQKSKEFGSGPQYNLELSDRELWDRIRNYDKKDAKAKRLYNGYQQLEPEDIRLIIRIQNAQCYYCKEKLNRRCQYHTETSSNCPDCSKVWSLDRIDNNLPHEQNNVVGCCVSCNVMKGRQQFMKFYEQHQLKRFEKDVSNKGVINLIDNDDTFTMFKKNIVGGPSLVFNRYHEKDITNIQKVEYDISKHEFKLGKVGKKCYKVCGFDANALYLYCIGQQMLCGKLHYEVTNNWEYYKTQILSGDFFGCCEVDIEVPEELWNKFCDFPPLFINVDVNTRNTGQYMNTVFNELGQKHKVEKKLIGSLVAKQKMFLTPLLKWYIEHGLKVTKLHGIIPAVKNNPFKDFMTWVATERRKGKISGGVLAEVAKLIGNTAYGGTLMNVEKHAKTVFVNEKEFNKIADNYLLKDVVDHKVWDENDNQNNPNGYVYEVTLGKSQINQTIPIQVGFAILQYAKLRMLQFYYDCLMKYYDPKEFQLMHMDTDSFYLAMSEDMYNKILHDENMKYNEKWFPSRDKKTKVKVPGAEGELDLETFENFEPGLFKTENIGDGEIALTCKTNYLIGPGKVTSKGGQKNRNKTTLVGENYKKSLFNIIQIKGINAGFRMRNNRNSGEKSMQTYYARKTILSPIYTKAVVMSDGIHIRPFKPEEIENEENIVGEVTSERDEDSEIETE